MFFIFKIFIYIFGAVIFIGCAILFIIVEIEKLITSQSISSKKDPYFNTSEPALLCGASNIQEEENEGIILS